MPTVEKKYLHNIDLDKNRLVNAKLHPVTTTERTTLASSLNSADEGLIVFDTTLDSFFVWDGNQWLQVSLSSTQITQITTAYNRSVVGVDVTSSDVARTVSILRQDGSTVSDVFQYAYIHTQSAPASVWNIAHNLGKYPSVTIVDTANSEVEGDVEYVDSNNITLRFTASFSGKAYIN